MAGSIGFPTTVQLPVQFSIQFQNSRGQTITSWRDGDQVTVIVKGGANLPIIQIDYRTSNLIGPSPVVILNTPYNPSVGLKYTFTAYRPTADTIHVEPRFGGASIGFPNSGASLLKSPRR